MLKKPVSPFFHFHPLPNDFRLVLFNTCFLFSFSRDRSIPELDDILDSKLSEVQDHMQKQVYNYFQLLCLLYPVLTSDASTIQV